MSILLETLKALVAPGHKPPKSHPGPGQPVLDLDPCNCLVKGRHGWFLANRNDAYLGRALVLYGECVEHEHDLLVRLIKPGDNVIEVGANIGVHTVGLARRLGGTGALLAVEPQPGIFRVLCANVALNALTNVQVRMCGCGAEEGTLYLTDVDYTSAGIHNSGSMELRKENVGTAVDVIPLDVLVPDRRRVSVIKIDVEGMEADVIRGARALIARDRPVLYVENDRPDRSQELIELVREFGYRMWWHIPPLFNRENFFANSVDVYGNVASFNMVCFPTEAVTASVVDGLTEVVNPSLHPLKP